MVFIEPHGGLANRLRVIASFNKLNINNKLLVYWVNNCDLGAEFLQLFDIIPNIEFKNQLSNKSKYIKNSHQDNYFKKKIVSISNSLMGIDFCLNDELVKNYRNSNNFKYLKDIDKFKNIYYRGCEEIVNTSNNDFYIFNPIQNIQKLIDTYFDNFSDKIIGFHIRRTDHQLAKKNSPNQLFFNKAEDLIDNGFQIYLASDDKELEDYMIKKYGKNNIKTQNKSSFNRNDLNGMKEAVIDMFLLSKTNQIFGSYWSSFGTVAAKIGNINHTYLTI